MVEIVTGRKRNQNWRLSISLRTEFCKIHDFNFPWKFGYTKFASLQNQKRI